MSENPMREIRMEKLTLNIGVGEAGPGTDKARALLEKLSGSKVVATKTHKRTTFGGGKGRPIGVKVTLRGDKAFELLGRLISAADNLLRPGQFDRNGNFSFGIQEYIHIPGVKYDPDIGMLGMDVCVTLMRPGFRVSRRRIRPGRIGKTHKITPQEAQEWVIRQFKARVTEEEETRY
jgi:large subunit ribosomal protein L5